MVWKLDVPEQVIKNPVRSISVHSDVVLSMSFNTDGSRLATSCKDKKIRLINPHTGTLLQVCVALSLMFLSICHAHAHVFEAHIIRWNQSWVLTSFISITLPSPSLIPSLNLNYELGHRQHTVCALAQKCTSPCLPLWHHTSKSNTFKKTIAAWLICYPEVSISPESYIHTVMSLHVTRMNTRLIHNLFPFTGQVWLIFVMIKMCIFWKRKRKGMCIYF